MRQNLFTIPVRPGWEIPIYGYGVMLAIAIVVSTLLAARRANHNGGNSETIWDLMYWLFIPGLIGARMFFVIEYWGLFDPWYEIFFLWEGGLVIYGGATGALLGFLWFTYHRSISRLWLLDVIAPSLALGMALGRIGCLFTGCCYGDYCTSSWAIHFPPASPAHYQLVQRGHQSRLGFVVMPQDRRVLFVEPGTPAERVGLRPGDEIVAVEGRQVRDAGQLGDSLLRVGFSREPFELTVRRNGGQLEPMMLRASSSLPLHPTQVYSSINGFLLFLLLSALYPLRRRDGEVIAWFAVLYALTRFLIEYLRYDEPALWDMLTLSQNISLLLFLAGLGGWWYVRRQPPGRSRGTTRRLFPTTAPSAANHKNQ